QLANAKRYCSEAANISFQQYDFYSGLPFPGADFDATVAIEVFLHHPPEQVVAVLKKLSGISQFVVNIDCSEDWPCELPQHVWIHDFRSLYAQLGWKCSTFPIPEKVDGMQQKLFVAGAALMPELLELERTCARAAAQTDSGAAGQTAAGISSWAAQV